MSSSGSGSRRLSGRPAARQRSGFQTRPKKLLVFVGLPASFGNANSHSETRYRSLCSESASATDSGIRIVRRDKSVRPLTDEAAASLRYPVGEVHPDTIWS